MNIHGIELAIIGVLGIQIIYWIIWLIGVLLLKKTNSINNQHGVSVVVAANNELHNLKNTLPKILDQEYGLFEVIVVDDRSYDGSYEYLLELAKSQSNLKVISVNELPDHVNGKKYALTLGIKSATYDQILFTDADCYPKSRQWISSFARAWSKKVSFVLGFSQYAKQPGLLNYFIRFETLLTGIQYLASAGLGFPYMGVGRSLSYSKGLFISRKGFHGFQNMVGGDDDLFVNKHALNKSTNWAMGADALVISYPKTKLKDFWAQKIRHLNVGKRYSQKSKILLSIFSLTWIMSWFLSPFIFLSIQNSLLLGELFLLRFLLIGIVFVVFMQKSGAGFNLLGIMLLDFMFALYYFVTGIMALLTKRVKWR